MIIRAKILLPSPCPRITTALSFHTLLESVARNSYASHSCLLPIRNHAVRPNANLSPTDHRAVEEVAAFDRARQISQGTISPLDSALTKSSSPKSFRICTYTKGWRGRDRVQLGWQPYRNSLSFLPDRGTLRTEDILWHATKSQPPFLAQITETGPVTSRG